MPKMFIERLIIGLIPLIVSIEGLAETIECHGRKVIQIEGPLDIGTVAVKNDKRFDYMVVEISGDDVKYTENGTRGKTTYHAKIEGRSEDRKILKISLNTIVGENGKTYPYYSEVVSYLIVDLKGHLSQRLEIIPFKATFYTEFGNCKIK